MLQAWLTHQDSLTDKLKAHSNQVRLEVLQHAWQEDVLLERKIIMWAGLERCWYARTQIPSSTYQIAEALFARLTTQALGELIWHNPRIKREDFHHYAIGPHTPEYALLDSNWHEQRTELWARHSTLMVLPHYPFYLLEIF